MSTYFVKVIMSPSPKSSGSPPVRQTGLAVRRKLVGKSVRGLAPNAPMRKIRKKKGKVAGEKVLNRFIEKVVECNRQNFPSVVKRVMECTLSRSFEEIVRVGIPDLSVEVGLICYEELRDMTTKGLQSASYDINQYLTGLVQGEGTELLSRIGDKFGLNHQNGFDDSDDESEDEGDYVLPDSDGSPNPFEDPYTAPCKGREDHVYTEMCKPYVEITGLEQEEGVEIVVPAPYSHVAYYKTVSSGTPQRPVRPGTPIPSRSLEICGISSTETSPSLLRGKHTFS